MIHIKSKSAILTTLVLIFLLTGCIGGLDPHGSKIKRMYRDQITIDAILPTNAPSISQQYHRFPESSSQEMRMEHLGIDVTAKKGTPVIAAANGVVTQSLFEPAFGNTIEIDHGTDENGRRVKTIYKHLNTRNVETGDKVRRGQTIGGLGRTGVLATGLLHVHFEVQKENATGKMIAEDPSLYWARGVGKVTCYKRSKHWPKRPFKVIYPVICS